jgi:histidinol-phosphate aminotransferase
MARDGEERPDLQGLSLAFAAPDHVERLEPYQPGKPVEELERELGISNAIKMASNESPLGPSPLALEAARRAMTDAFLYPDSACFALRRALAARLAIDPDEIVVGAGSNELIFLLVRTFCLPGRDTVVTHRNAFLSYNLAARTHAVDFVETPVHADLRCDVEALCAAFDERTRIVFVGNPNNPTGAHLSREELEQILERAPARALVVVDEAYHEYAAALDPDYPDSQVYRRERPALVTLRTFSKIYGLAGLRIGYALCDLRAAQRINRARMPFNVSGVAQAAALAALDDDAHVAATCAAARVGLDALRSGLSALGLHVPPSLGNFVLVGLGRAAEPIYQELLRRGVIARPLAGWGLPEHLRLSLAEPADISRAVAAVAAVLRA